MLACFDDEIPLKCEFSHDNRLIFLITKNCLFIYQTENFTLVLKKIFKEEIISMSVLTTHPYVILTTKNDVCFYNILEIQNEDRFRVKIEGIDFNK